MTNEPGRSLIVFIDKSKDEVIKQHKNIHKLLLLFIESELTKLSVWSNPLNTVDPGNPVNFIGNTEKSMVSDVRFF